MHAWRNNFTNPNFPQQFNNMNPFYLNETPPFKNSPTR